MEDRLSIDISEALAAAARVDAAFAQIGQTFQDAINNALQQLGTVDATVEVQADTDAIAPAVDDAIAAADTVVPVEADPSGVTDAVDGALAAADTTVEVDADVSDAQDAIDTLSGQTVEVDVAGGDAAAQQLDHVSSSAHAAGESAHGASEEFALLGVGSKLAAGEIGALSEGLHLTGGVAATAAAGIAAVAVVGKELVSNAIDARSAQERFNLVLGESAEKVEHINIGGLNEDLETFSTRLGATGKEIENAASKIFTIGTAAGAARPALEETTEQVLALAGRAVALNPALGNVGSAAERLFSGLARGGRFAANFGIALTSAEINARALADTGKAAASDLNIYEKAAAGAALATEKLGDHLSEDINAGAQNIQIRFNAVKAALEETFEAAGQPLIDPLLESIQKGLPSIQNLAEAFAKVLEPALEIAAALADSLAPAIEGLQAPAEGLAAVLGVVADVLGAIPAPVTQAVVAFVAFNAILKAIAATSLISAASGFSGLSGILTRLPAAIGPAAVALAATAGTMAFLKSQAKETDDAVSGFLDDVIEKANNAEDIEALVGILDQVHSKAQAERDAAAKNRGGFLGDLTTRGETRGFDESAAGLESIDAAGRRVVQRAKELQEQFGLTSAAALNLARSGDEAIESFEKQGDVLEQLTADQKAAARSTEDFWLSAQTGSLSSADIANRAAETGVAFEDLAKSVSDARQPIVDFATQVSEALPGIDSAFADLADNQGLHTFLENAQKDVAAAAAFVSNLDELIARGATNLASTLEGLAQQDPAKAARLAAQAVKESAADLGKDEAKAAGLNFQETFVTFATQNVTDKLNGGLELQFNQTQEAIGERLAKIPGQVEPEGKVAGEGIVANVLVSVKEALEGFAEPWHAAGVEAGEQLAAGVGQGLDAQTSALLDAPITRLRDKVQSIMNKVFLISSPSKLTEQIGKLVAAGFFVGLADTSGAADAIKPLLDVVDKFDLNSQQIAQAAGRNVDEITASLTQLGESLQDEKLSPDQLLKVGDAVKALGGSKGVKELQAVIAQQVSAAFGGVGVKEIESIMSGLNTKAALGRLTAISGVTPRVPDPFATNVVRGADATAGNGPAIENLNVTVTPPPDATPQEIAGDVAVAAAWAFRGVSV